MFSLPILATDGMDGSMVARKISIYLQTNTYFRPRRSIDSSLLGDSNCKKDTITT